MEGLKMGEIIRFNQPYWKSFSYEEYKEIINLVGEDKVKIIKN